MTFTNTDYVNFKVHGEKPTLYKVTAMSKLRIEWGSVLRYPTSRYWATLCNVDTLDEERVFQQVHWVNHILQYAVKNKICEEIDK
jgi:hypothetical protein